MKTFQVMVMVVVAMSAVSCVSKAPSNPDASPESADAPSKNHSAVRADKKVLFEDPMTGSWQDHWFLDGKKAVVTHDDNGLTFWTPSSGVSSEEKNKFRAKFDSHHAVLWTKQVFEGDIRISYRFTRIQSSWACLLYIHAQGIGTPPYGKDIHAWHKRREVASMDKYFKYMNLLSLSLRRKIRCKRYPWYDVGRGIKHDDILVKPMVGHDGLPTGKTFNLVVEKRKKSCTLRIREVGREAYTVDHAWDLSNPSKDRKTPFVEKGRIGLRQMGGNKVVYRNFKVEQLEKQQP